MGLLFSILASTCCFLRCDPSVVSEPTSVQETAALKLMLNQPNLIELQLRRFRTMTSEYITVNDPLPTRKGLAGLKFSGSAQFSGQSIHQLFEKIPSPQIIVVDLRQESHGFINEMPISWVGPNDWSNKGKSLEFILEDETRRLEQSLMDKTITVDRIIKKEGHVQLVPFTVQVKEAITEETLCTQLKLGYIRIPVTDHLKPEPAEVDRFLNFYKSLNKEAWIHFHCNGGMGRTTTFLCMCDMMHNARQVPLADILKRQWLLGGQNFAEPALSREAKKWPEEFAGHLQFLHDFYDYCLANQDEFQVGWQEWLASQSVKSLPK